MPVDPPVTMTRLPCSRFILRSPSLSDPEAAGHRLDRGKDDRAGSRGASSPERRARTTGHRKGKAERRKEAFELIRLRMNDLDAAQGAAARRGSGRAPAPAPVDEEWNEASIRVVGDAKHAPAQPAPVWKAAPAFVDGARSGSCAPCPGDDVGKVDPGHRPVVEALNRHVPQLA